MALAVLENNPDGYKECGIIEDIMDAVYDKLENKSEISVSNIPSKINEIPTVELLSDAIDYSYDQLDKIILYNGKHYALILNE